MQVTVSSAGDPDSYALLLLLKHSADNGRLVRHFVCCECQGLVEAVQGWDYLHTCETPEQRDRHLSLLKRPGGQRTPVGVVATLSAGTAAPVAAALG